MFLVFYVLSFYYNVYSILNCLLFQYHTPISRHILSHFQSVAWTTRRVLIALSYSALFFQFLQGGVSKYYTNLRYYFLKQKKSPLTFPSLGYDSVFHLLRFLCEIVSNLFFFLLELHQSIPASLHNNLNVEFLRVPANHPQHTALIRSDEFV